MEIVNYLDAQTSQPPDPGTGLSIRRLTADPQLSLYFAAIDPGVTLPAHYHKDGAEAYHIVGGRGEIAVGALKGDAVEWQQAASVKAGDCFSIRAGQVHRLVNSGDTILQVVFSAPPPHLGEDRFFVSIEVK
ncbi:cupin domain-containing protein [Anaeroselena agilis]|uniref:Cupin domain-containing protein n=1 Tax=Anaeroselena agilis TaxID=3063788 RepID=A0ABU3P2G8_9FIRM|nr:cupin domain-containing protein [Selenomonadales bacterium 4137-cl]